MTSMAARVDIAANDHTSLAVALESARTATLCQLRQPRYCAKWPWAGARLPLTAAALDWVHTREPRLQRGSNISGYA